MPTHRRTKSFFSELLVGVPAKGFLKCIENMLDDKLIQLRLNTPWREEFRKEYSRIIWTGRIDEVIPEMKCSVSFRSVCQEFAPLREWPSTDAGVINYPGKEVEYIRRSNYDMLLPWRPQVIGTEYACDVGYPAYPLRTHRAIVAVNEIKLQISEQIPDLTLHGRLGLFNYISMSQAIDNSLALVRSLKLIAPSSF